MTGRIKIVDYMKAFSILAVVLNHTPVSPQVHTIVYLVCLPAFFFTAGLFAHTQLSPKDFFLRKTTRLLIPFFFWGIVSWLFWLFIGRKYGSYVNETASWWYPLLGLISGKTEMLIQNRPLWFLCCLVSLEWIYYLIVRLRRTWVRWLIILCVGAFGCALSYWRQNWIWEISAACIILPLYAFSAEYGLWIKDKVQSYGPWGWLVGILLSVIGIAVGVIYNGGIGLHDSYIGNPLIYYLSCVSVVGLWLFVSLYIDRFISHTQWLQYIGQNTLFILCAHMMSFSVIKGIALLCHISLDFFETGLGCVCLWAGSLALLLPAVYVINRYCPWILGKRKSTPLSAS